MKKVLAFDFGASSGRAVIFEIKDGKLEMQEVHRFPNDPVKINGTLYWDTLRLFHEIKVGIINAKNAGGFDSIGIDTWGVDFGMLDREGNLIENPVHYRDTRTEGIMEEVFEKIAKKQLYMKTGLQFMRFNTLYQLYYLKTRQPKKFENCHSILMIADLFSYFLTGEKKSEFSNVSTTQMLEQNTNDWHYELLEELTINASVLTNIIHSGEVYGYLSDELCEELGVSKVPIIAVASHDTASAVIAVPSNQDDFLFISCGTWSLFGTELDRTIISEKGYDLQITNERGHNKTTRLLKNIMGLWIIQECKRQWEKEGSKISFSEIARLAAESQPFKNFIDVDSAIFELPGDMPKKIKNYCKEHGQPTPENIGEIARCVYESLAFKYKKTFDEIQKLTGKKYQTLNIVGGGCNAEILCEFTANACGVPVYAGPSEGTATGNAVVQLMALEQIKDIKEARAIIGNSFDIKTYMPNNHDKWQEKYNKLF